MTSRLIFAAALSGLATVANTAVAQPPLKREPLTASAVDDATFSPLPDKPHAHPHALPEIIKAEVLLDRARFSPGAIDGVMGDNLREALIAYQRQMRLDPTGTLDAPTWDRLTAGVTSPPLTTYTITKADAHGPFTKRIPLDFEAQSRLRHLGYHDIREELSERFHMSRSLLAALNPGNRFGAGDQIVVTDINTERPTVTSARIVVDKAAHDVEALAADGSLLAFYPASIGSADKPAPTGDFTIHRIDHNPIYTYDPKYHFKGVSATEPFSIAPGPNNPVGLVWMDLGGDGYGIHGTPDPEAVGKTQSHGCIRMTNWDALDLAAMVDKGTPVSFGDVPGSTGPITTPPVATAVPPPVASGPGPAAPAEPASAAGGSPKTAP